MNQDQHILLDKELRGEIDFIIHRLRTGMSMPASEHKGITLLALAGSIGDDPEYRNSPERSMAATKLQEAVMWLDLDVEMMERLQRAADAESDSRVEERAKAICRIMQTESQQGARYPWVPNGNSDKQEEARLARREMGLT